MLRGRMSGRVGVLFVGALAVGAVALVVVPRIPALAGYRYLGVLEAAPAAVPLGIDPMLTISDAAAETDAIWVAMDATRWESPAPFDGPPDVDYDREILALATYFGSSFCAPSFGGVDFRDGAATVRVDPGFGLGGCTADAVPYTFVVAIARDRLSGGPPEIFMLPTPRPIAIAPSPPPATSPAATPATSGDPSPSAPPNASGPPPPSFDPAWVTRPALWCGSRLRFPPEAITRGLSGAENWIDGAAAELRRIVREEATPDSPLPLNGWFRVVDTGSDVLFVARGTAEVPWVQVAVATEGNGWTVAAYGQCHLGVSYPDGITGATIRLDPAFPRPTRDSREVHVLITETACASGQSPEGRVLEPLVVYGPDSVAVAIAIRHIVGGADCQSNPEFPVLIELSEPLGDRVLVDGSQFPPRPLAP